MNLTPFDLRRFAELLVVLAFVGAAALFGSALMGRVIGKHPLG